MPRSGAAGVSPVPTGGGWLLPVDQITVPIDDRGWMLGEGLFETIRFYDGRAPLLDRHWRRLNDGSRLLGFPRPPAIDVEAVLAALIEANGLKSGWARITYTRGQGGRGYDPPPGEAPATGFMVIQAGSWQPPDKAFVMRVSAWPVAPHPILSRVKSTSALPKIIARAERAGDSDEILLVDPGGHVVEATASNIFWVENGVVRTPSVETGCLPGVARSFILENFYVEVNRYRLERLCDAGEVFLTNALMGVVPVREITGIGRYNCPGPVTLEAARKWSGLFRCPLPQWMRPH